MGAGEHALGGGGSGLWRSDARLCRLWEGVREVLMHRFGHKKGPIPCPFEDPAAGASASP